MGEKEKSKKVKETPKSTKYIVDVPNFDKDGNDVSGDKPVSGGRRRKDGTLETTTENYTCLMIHLFQIDCMLYE